MHKVQIDVKCLITVLKRCGGYKVNCCAWICTLYHLLSQRNLIANVLRAHLSRLAYEELYKTWLRRESFTPQTDMFSRASPPLHMVQSVHEFYQMVKTEGNNNMIQPSLVWARGPYPVMVGLGEAWCCQSHADHSLPLLTRVNHCLLRQEGRPLQHHQLLLLHVCDSLVALEKWGSCVFPDGQVSKSRDESKPRAWKSSAHLRKPLLLWAVHLWGLTRPLLLDEQSSIPSKSQRIKSRFCLRCGW